MIKVTIWNEYLHEIENEAIAKIYPLGIHNQIASIFHSTEFQVRTATLSMPEHGLTKEVLEDTDVLIWWGHKAHNQVLDEVASRVRDRVLQGMGLIVLHSGHFAKPFKLLMGTSCTLSWRDNDRERLWCVNPAHPIAAGVPLMFELPQEEMYGEVFDIPTPDELIYLGWFHGGEVFRSGCTFQRGYGKIFYFQPGHETFPIYHDENIQKIIKNSVIWACPKTFRKELSCIHQEKLEK